MSRATPLRLTFAALAAALSLCALAPPAGAYVYWANNVAAGSIGRAGLGGSGADQAFITGTPGPCGIAVDDLHVYWAIANNPAGGTGTTIARANIDGSGVNSSFVGGAHDPCGVAVDGAHIYWGNFPDSIGRANLDGTGANQDFITGTGGSYGIAVDGAHIYWTSYGGTIGRANLDGTSPVQTFITGANKPAGVAVDAAHVYWSNCGDAASGSTIGRANIDGSVADQSFITGAAGPCGIAVDSGHVYWANTAGDRIGRANLDGTGANQSFITGASIPYGVAVDSKQPPAAKKEADVKTVSGTVTVACKGQPTENLTDADRIRLGCTVDTTKGTVSLTTSNGEGGAQAGQFTGGVFVPTQVNEKDAKGKKVLITDLTLTGTGPTGCTKGKLVSAKRRTRHLFGNAHGRFRTRGRRSAATVRGTQWDVTDRCDGTLTEVKKGVVSVRDFTLRKTVTVKAGHKYLAPAKKP